MKQNSPKYKAWRLRQDKKKLIQRTKRNRHRRNYIHAKNESNRIQNQINRVNTDGNISRTFHAPENFSIINNTEETVGYFNRVISYVTDQNNFGKQLFFDISSVRLLSIDALMYLLAIVNNLNQNFAGKYSFSGNEPSDDNVNKLFKQSGFYHFVRRHKTDPIIRSKDNIEIVSGENCETEIAKRIIDFVCEKTNFEKKGCRFLYDMCIELMSNTRKHAYDESITVLYPRWYYFVEYDKQNMISFSFMDTGAGIPSTVQKNFAEKIDFLGIKDENKYVVSALEGDFRTSTQMGYHGKGLPKIRKYCSDGKIENLHIITNKADVNVKKNGYISNDLLSPLRGTLYYWQINISNLKKD